MTIANTKYAGRSLTLAIGDSANPASAVFTVIGGVRTKGATLNQEQIDITDGDDDVWRKLLEGGVRSMDLSVAGLVSNNVSYELMRAKAQAGTIWAYQIAGIGDGDFYKGLFQVSNLAESGEYKGAQEFTATLLSGDTVTATNT